MKRSVIASIVASYDDSIIRLYSMIRFLILRQPFLEEIGQYLPREGRVLDLGCGFGLFSLYFAMKEPGRQMTGVELNSRRVDCARGSARTLGLTNARYEVNDVLDWKGTGSFDAIYLLDLIHHLPQAEVKPFMAKVRALLRPGGTLLVKDVSDRPFYKRWFTLWLDRLMVGMNEPIRYWPPQELSELLNTLGFDVKRHAMKDFLPYPHVLYVCTLRSEQDEALEMAGWLRDVTES